MPKGLIKKARLYDETAWLYDERYGAQQSLKHSLALLELPVNKGDVVVDLGCGTGDLLTKIRRMCNSCLGIDFSIGMLLEARRKYADLDLVLADVHNLPLRDGACNKFFAITLLQNINEQRLFSELIRVCRPGSRGVASTIIKKARPRSPFNKYAEKILEVDEDLMFLVRLPT